MQPDSVQIKELSVKFLEVFVMLFTVEVNDYERSFGEGNFSVCSSFNYATTNAAVIC